MIEIKDNISINGWWRSIQKGLTLEIQNLTNKVVGLEVKLEGTKGINEKFIFILKEEDGKSI